MDLTPPPASPSASAFALTPRRREAIATMGGMAVGSAVGGLVAIAAGLVAWRWGRSWGTGVYATGSILSGLWLVEHHPVGGGILAGSGVAAGAAMIASHVNDWFRVASSGVIQPYEPPRGPFAQSLSDIAEGPRR